MSYGHRKATKVDYVCPDCGTEFEVSVSEYWPERISGPPEDCYPAEGGEIEPDFCPNCGHPVDGDAIWNASEMDGSDEAYDDYANNHYRDEFPYIPDDDASNND